MDLGQTIDESKAILEKYKSTPFVAIPKEDVEKFNVAWIIVQAAIGQKAFRAFVTDREYSLSPSGRCPSCGSFSCGCAL